MASVGLVATTLLYLIPACSGDCVKGDCTDGYGWWEWKNGDKYYGSFSNQKRHGLGIYFSESGSKYEGKWVEDSKHGHGIWTWADGTRYTGKWKEDLHHGYGIYMFSGGEMYQGGYDHGKRQGQGINTWPSGDSYEGDFYQDKRKGRGCLSSATGSRYEGDWVDDKIHGFGVWTWANGNSFEGEWTHGDRAGYGTYTWADGSMYRGEWRRSKEFGYGIRSQKGILWGNRTIEGRWFNGKLQEWVKVPSDFGSLMSTALVRTKRAQQASMDTVLQALASASNAQESARAAVIEARKAKNLSRSVFPEKIEVPWRGSKLFCSPVPRFTHGEVQPDLEYYDPGDILSLSCSNGYYLVGSLALRVCGEDGKWADGNHNPVCRPNNSNPYVGPNMSGTRQSARGPSIKLNTPTYESAEVRTFLGECRLLHLQGGLEERMQIRSLNQLLLHITRQTSLATESIRPQYRRRLLSCAQDYLMKSTLDTE